VLKRLFFYMGFAFNFVKLVLFVPLRVTLCVCVFFSLLLVCESLNACFDK
jgi:hypothetical protein